MRKEKISNKIKKSQSYLKSWFKTFSGSLTLLCLVFLIFLPFFSQEKEFTHYFLPQFTLAFIFAIFAASWDLLTGINGQVSFGHAIFFGIAGYISGAFILNLNFPVWIAIIIGLLGTIIVGLLIGIPCLRLKGPYLALGTLAFSIILLKLFAMGSLAKWLGGNEGLSGLPNLVESPILEYFIIFISMVIIFIIIIQISKSNFGTILKSIRDDEVGADASGINVMKYKTYTFMLSAMVAGFAGIFFALHYNTVNPSGNLSSSLSFSAILMASLGGIGTITGSALGAFFFIFLEYILIEVGIGLNLVRIVFAFFLMIVIRFSERGILRPILEYLKNLWDVLLGR